MILCVILYICIMREYNSSLVIDILRKDYPEIESRILQRIDDEVPQKLSDMDLIPVIVSSFKFLKGIGECNWVSTTRSREKVNDHRDLLLAVIMLFYHPEKMMMITKDKAKYGLLCKVSYCLGFDENTILSKSLPAVIVAFRAYKDFKEEVHRVYELIKIEHKFFQ